MTTRCSLFSCLTLLLVPTMEVLAQAPTSLLLRIDTSYSSTVLCSRYAAEMFIYRDGLVVETTHFEDGEYVMSRAQASEPVMARLNAALSANRVGFAVGGCGVDLFEIATFYDVTVTWFGKPPRQRTFAVEAPGTPACPAETNALFTALRLFRSEAFSSDPDRTSAEIHFPPAPGCER